MMMMYVPTPEVQQQHYAALLRMIEAIHNGLNSEITPWDLQQDPREAWRWRFRERVLQALAHRAPEKESEEE